MLRYRIEGGRTLTGRVAVHGAKNAALPILTAAVLAGRPCVVEDVPRLTDVDVTLAILRRLGVVVEERSPDGERGGRALAVDAGGLDSYEVPADLMRRMRSSIALLGPLLARFGRARVSYPGGCVIGPRPIDFHLKGLRLLGAEIEEEPGGFLLARAKRLRGADIYLDQPSVGATEHLLMAAVLAEGTTVIRGAAREPEVVDLQTFLNALGARVSGAGTDTIQVAGSGGLGGCTHRIIPDRIEAGTFLCAAAATGGRVKVVGAVPQHLAALLAKLREIGCRVWTEGAAVEVSAPDRPEPTDLTTLPYPGFPTDLQNPFLACLLRARGTSVVTETVFENRFRVLAELQRMGARASAHGRSAIIQGVPRLTGAPLEASDDLRGAASLVVAALSAEGTSYVDRMGVVERGYEDLAGRLRGLGAEVRTEEVEGQDR